jgi:hypothetical protein
METKKTIKTLTYLLIAIILSLLGYLVYDSIANDGLSQEEIVAEMKDLRSEYDYIQGELNKRNDNLQEKNQAILKIQLQLKSIFDKKNISEDELKKAKQLIKDLNKIAIGTYKDKIVTLEGEKEVLVVKNTELVVKNTELVIKTTNQEKSIDELKSKINNEQSIAKKKDQLLDYASNLMASNFVLKSFKVRDNGKEIPTEKGSRVDRIKVFFDIPENKIAKSGKIILYVKIILPDGKLAILEGKNDLKFKNQENQMVDCSEIVEFNYTQGKEETIHFNWDNKDGFDSGDYMFEVYQNGRLIGKASKFLR